MITITHNKIAGFEPRWARFPGFSLLFDNPGAYSPRSGDLAKLWSSLEEGGPLDLYSRLEKTITELDRDLLMSSYLFCPLPPPSYHVTVWDGVNAGNVSTVQPAQRPEWNVFLAAVPESLRALPESMRTVLTSQLVHDSFGSIQFEFDKLTIWGSHVLVARLRPMGAESGERLQHLVSSRAALCDVARAQIGIETTKEYNAHVSLGYFANRQHGELASGRLGEWTERFRGNCESAAVAFESINVYAFSDMASYFARA